MINPRKKFPKLEETKPDNKYISLSSYLLGLGDQKNRNVTYKQVINEYLRGGFSFVKPGAICGLVVGENGREEIRKFLGIETAQEKLARAKQELAESSSFDGPGILKPKNKSSGRKLKALEYDLMKVDPRLLPYRDEGSKNLTEIKVGCETNYFKDRSTVVSPDEQFKPSAKVSREQRREYLKTLSEMNPSTLLRATELRDKYGLPLDKISQLNTSYTGAYMGYPVSAVIPVLESLLEGPK
jgi:hypothetical protein